MRSCFVAVAVAFVAACPPVGEGEGEGEGEEGEGEGEGEGEEGEGEGEDVGARFVAVGYGGRRMTSSDGAAWENDQEDAAGGGDDDDLLRGACTGVVNGQQIVLAVGGSAAGRVARSVDGGASWTEIVDDRGWIGACAFSDNEVVFVGSARSARSVDGGLSLIDLDTHFLADGNWEMRDVIFANGTFVAAGDLGVFTSSDGVAWAEAADAVDGLFRVSFGNGVFVATGFDRIATSTNLVDWDVADVDGGGVGDVVFAEGRFLIVGEGFREESTNGVDWTRNVNPAMSRVAFGEVAGVGVYVGANFPDQRRVSTDGGVTWTDSAREDGNAIDDVVFVP